MRRLFSTAVIAAAFGVWVSSAAALPNHDPVPGTAGFNARVRAIAQTPTAIFVGGGFTRVNGKKDAYLARLGRGGKLTKWRGKTNGLVWALALSRDRKTLFIGGSFSRVNGVVRHNIAAVRTGTGRIVRAFKARTDGTVRALVVRRNTLFMGGDFKTVRGAHRVRLAAVSTGRGRVGGWNPFANRAVRALAVSANGQQLIAGGDFTKVAGKSGKKFGRAYIASFKTGRATTASFHPNVGFPVNAIRTAKNVVYVGTSGECAPNDTCNSAIAYNANNSITWRCQTDGDVHSLVRAGSVLYAGGHWRHIVDGACVTPGQDRARLMALKRWNGRLATGWHPGSSGFGILALSAFRSRLAIGGDFNKVAGFNRDNYVQFGGSIGTAR